MSGRTALIAPTRLLELDGIDDIEQMEGAANPFWNRTRFEITWGLPVSLGWTQEPNIEIMKMREATTEELRLFHDPSYIETLDLFGNMGTAFSTRFGLPSNECPVFRDVNVYSRLTAGATIDAVLGVARGEFKNAMSFYGGFHHAMESKAAGFCYLNDCVVALKKLREEFPDMHVLYLDTDVHHGDGVQQAFYDDPNVLTISLHEKSMGFFPMTGSVSELGTGEGTGYSVNVPLPPLTDDVEYWHAFEKVVILIWQSYQPDFVFWNVGADAHKEDPLADLLLTLATYRRLSRTVLELSQIGDQRLAIVGGGGYDPVSTARVWAIILADIAGLSLPPSIPDKWAELCRSSSMNLPTYSWVDSPIQLDTEHIPKIRGAVERTISEIHEKIFPALGITNT